MNDYTRDGFQFYTTDLIALNNSGVAGKVTILFDAAHGSVAVGIEATGLEPDQMHVQHIHGFDDDSQAMSPTIARDADQDGFVELGEGLASYGPIQLNLTLDPAKAAHDHGTAGHDHTADAVFPTAGPDRTLHYRETFHFDPADPNAQAILAGITPLMAKEIVLHGESVAAGSGAGTTGEVDGTAGYKVVLPVASGELHAVTDPLGVLQAAASLQEAAYNTVDWGALAHLYETHPGSLPDWAFS
ncbi:hypothetical protein [Dankookia sp. GCM10030260]|uniref:hypothetical protein n=1 Tax=Dankookia sp. GCM10030260 TaxID=3273390 RepID=UPI0036D24C10